MGRLAKDNLKLNEFPKKATELVPDLPSGGIYRRAAASSGGQLG